MKKSKTSKTFCLFLGILSLVSCFCIGSKIYKIQKYKLQSYDVTINDINVNQTVYPSYRSEQITLNVTASPAEAIQSIELKSSDSSIVSIDENGILTSHKPGTALITICIKTKNNTDHLTWTKIQIMDDINDKSSYLLEINQSAQLSSGNLKGPFIWSSSDENIISITNEGQATATGYGYALITCKGVNGAIIYYLNVIDLNVSDLHASLTTIDIDNHPHAYHVYKQTSMQFADYNDYLLYHGCATSSLTTILNGFTSKYSTLKPNETIKTIEKKLLGEKAWNKNYQKLLLRQMPVSLNGFSHILNKLDIPNEYIPFFEDHEAKEDILTHLKSGKPVVIEVKKYNRYTKKTDKKMTGSYHTVILAGIFHDGRVLMLDPNNQSYYKGAQRMKILSLDDIIPYMFSCEEEPDSYYFNSGKKCGGYIKIK